MTEPEEPTLPAHRREDRTAEDVRLLPKHRWGMIAVLVIVFLVGGERPVWNDPFDIDRAIWFSYVPIPLLVAGSLYLTKRLSAVTWVLNTVEVTLLKFVITYGIAVTLWATMPAPEPPPVAEGYRHEPVEAPPRPPVTPWNDEQRGSVRGVVTNEDGPVANALIYVSAGLEDITFAVPTETVFVTREPEGFAADLVVVQRHQPLVGKSGDKRLHPMRVTRDETILLTTPLLADGSENPIPTAGLDGAMTMRCVLHDEIAHLVVLHHPHHTRTDAEGRFDLPGVPALEVTVTALLPSSEASRGGRAEAPATIAAGGELELALTLER